MLSRVIAAIITLSSGCTLLFDATAGDDKSPDGPPDDGNHDGPRKITGRFHDWYGFNSDSGPKLLQEQVDLSGATVRARLRDGREVTVTQDPATKEFSFEVPAAATPYAVEIHDNLEAFEIQHAAEQLDIVRRNVGHPAAVVGGSTAKLAFASPLAPVGSRVLVAGSGVQVDSLDSVFAWDGQTTVDTTHGDGLFLVQQSGVIAPGSGGYKRISQIGRGPTLLTQPADGTTTVTGVVLESIGTSLCTTFSARIASELMRLQQAQGTLWVASEATWAVQAVGSAGEIGPLGRLTLAGAERLNTLVDVTNAALEYPNVLVDHDLVASQILVTRREVRRRGADTPTNVDGGTAVFARVPRTVMLETTCGSADLGLGLALPTRIDFAGARIDGLDGITDDVSIERGGVGDLLLTWEIAAQDAPDFYVVQLLELVSTQIGNGTRVSRIRQFTTTRPELGIVRDLVSPNHSYVFKIVGFGGYPNAAAGDFRPLAYPQRTATLHTSSFTITQ